MDLQEKLKQWQETYDKVTLVDLLKNYRKFLKRLPDISHLKNVALFGGLATMIIFILFAQRFASLYSYLPKKPIHGGTYTEGVVGKIEQLNPLFSPTNSAETSVVSLIFSGLTKKDNYRRSVPDLAERWEVGEDGKSYKFFLRKNVKWHDGEPFTADDVVFTINTIQNPDTRTPIFEVWKGVEVEKNDDFAVTFKLPNPYAPFISETDLSMLPKHLLETVPARNLKIAEYSNKPVGTGPFRFKEIKSGREGETVTLISNQNYYSNRPFIETFIFKSYPNQQALNEAYVKKEVKGVERVKANANLPGIKVYQLATPDYDVLYFNLRNGFTKDRGLREAISLAIDRQKIVKEVYGGEAEAIAGPILPGYFGHNKEIKANYDLASAKQKLTDAGYVNENGRLKKDGKVVTLRLLFSNERTAESKIVKTAIENLGIEIKEERYSMAALVQDHIRPRDFDLLLISQNLGSDPDLYSFWHSTQNNDPGLNFSGLSDRFVDKLLEQGRTILDQNARKDRYVQVSKLINEHVPAVFLVTPSYLYGVSQEVRGIETMKAAKAKDRFSGVENWYVLERREQ